jgi:hypothetical protein
MKNRHIPDYEKKNPVKESFNPANSQLDCQNLYDCIEEIFPDTRPQRLREWREMMQKKSVEPELFLFMASICGTHFRIISPDLQLKDVQEYLYRWLAWGDDLHRMRPDVAELVVAALSPGIRREINARGHQRGLSDEEHFRKKGRIPQFRGAWVAALIIENHFKETGMELTQAKDQVVKLISVLLEKKEENTLRDFNKLYKDAPKDVISDLTRELIKEYEFWMIQDGVYGGDLEPPEDQVEEHSEWKSRHKSLQNLFKQNGCERFCDLVVSRIKYDLWKPLWDMKAEQIDKEEESE